jgi:glutathione synthase/RimK-type ligase-like ATP-grasp enzyme
MPENINKAITIAICRDNVGKWHDKFVHAMDKNMKDYNILYEVINIDNHNWIEAVKKFDAIIYKSSFMGVESSTYYKEKIYFIEYYLKKLVLPNFNTVWHFESKIAQSYLLRYFKINTPTTFVSFNYHDAINEIHKTDMPLVMKKSYGAGSSNVQLIKNINRATRYIANIFCNQLWHERQELFKDRFRYTYLLKGWFWQKVFNNIMDKNRFLPIYWQSFVSNNDKDLRITVIGDRYAFAFWRKNRKNDFRASGSGNLDFNTPIPEDPLRYCIDLNKKFGFDSMAYDILFVKDGFVITEMSYAYSDVAIYQSPGYFELLNNKFIMHEGNFWPQFLWVDWLLLKLQGKGSRDKY